MTSKKPPSRRGFQKVRLPLPLKLAFTNYKQAVVTRVGEWHGSWQYWWGKAEYNFFDYLGQLRKLLSTPVRTPRKMPLWVFIALGILVLIGLWLMFVPRPISHTSYSPYRSLPGLVTVEEYSYEEDEVLNGCSCTDYILSKYPQVAGMGSIWDWAYEAELRGWRVSRTPGVGAVGIQYWGGLVDKDGKRLPHAFIVDEVNGTMIKYSDWNSALGGYDNCVTGYSDWVKVGVADWYIYPK
jgi:hypothetical protein